VFLESDSLAAYSGAERSTLLAVACDAVARAARGDSGESTPAELGHAEDASPARLAEPRGCFVTLERAGELRGCIGQVLPRDPLITAVRRNARNAALSDPRFPPLEPSELVELTVEISVLSLPERITFNAPAELLRRLVPGRDGVLLEWPGARATFLPQVWEKLPDAREFMARLARKAGGAGDAWTREDALISVYTAEAFVAPWSEPRRE
jgi:AmmeMemoRadiSam system protein A